MSTTTAEDKRRRRHRVIHPGVKIKKPDPENRMPYYRAVFVDPDKAKEVYVRFDPDLYPSDEARREWAATKSAQIRARADELRNGARKGTGEGFEELVELFFDNSPQLRDGTLGEYRRALRNFVKWATFETESVTPDTIKRSMLMKFRAWSLKLPKRKMARGAKKGTTTEAKGRRTELTINGELRVVGTFLRWLIAAERLPHLHIDDLIVALKKYKVEFEYPEFHSRKQIATSIEAAMRHDAATFKMTRDEKRALGERRDSEEGSTARFPQVAALVTAAYLTGMRLDELCLIEWQTHIDLDYEDFDGQVVGQIKLRAPDTKTKRARFVTFEVSPLLRQLILALKHKNGNKGSVFGVTYDEAQDAMARMRDDFGAPDTFTFQMCRSTCSTYLVNAPGIYGAAASFHSAKQLGHTQAVQEKHYAGLIKGIKPEIKTLEAAMQIESQAQAVIDGLLGKRRFENVVSIS